MRHLTMLLVSGMLATGLLASCSGNSTTGPSNGGGGGTPPSGMPPGGGGGTSQQPSGGSPAPATAAVDVGDIFFKSVLNGSSNPAVDTVAVNGTVTWTWTGSLPHGIQSLGSPSFTNSVIQSGSGKTYQFKFTAPGTYQYDCQVHGQMMTGTIVVMAAGGSSSMPPPSMPPPSTPAPPGY